MKKFLDFTHDNQVCSKFPYGEIVPVGALNKHDQIVKRILEKVIQGINADKTPHVLFFDSQNHLQTALFFAIYTNSVIKTGKNQFLFESIADRSILEFAKLAKKFQINPQLISVEKDGRLSLNHLKEKISLKTQFFSQKLYQPLLGVINDQHEEIKEILKDHDVLYHLDVTDVFGQTVFDLSFFDADFISMDLSRLHSSLNGSVLFSKKPLEDLLVAPKNVSIQELEAFLKTLENLYEDASSKMLNKISLKMKLTRGLKEIFPDFENLIKPPLESISKVLFLVPGVHQEALAFMLLSKSILLDLGGEDGLSLKDTLMLLGYDEKEAQTAISLSIQDYFVESDIERFLEELQKAYKALKKGALS